METKTRRTMIEKLLKEARKLGATTKDIKDFIQRKKLKTTSKESN